MDHFLHDLKSHQEKLLNALLQVDRLTAKEILTYPYPGASALQVVENLVVPVLEQVGLGWEKGSYSLSQVYMSGRICEELVDLILPPSHTSRLSQPKMAIATLEDYHVLGKRIVYSTLRASGFEIENYGQMTTEELAERATSDQTQILLISVLMLPSALRVKALRDQLRKKGSRVKIVVGGAPFRFDPLLWREVGADAFGETASEAVHLVHTIIQEMQCPPQLLPLSNAY